MMVFVACVVAQRVNRVPVGDHLHLSHAVNYFFRGLCHLRPLCSDYTLLFHRWQLLHRSPSADASKAPIAFAYVALMML
jgi:hypothetical protein